MKLLKSEIAIIFAMLVTLTYSSISTNALTNVSDKVIRFHVVANSDSDFDQQLKIDVKNSVFEFVSILTHDCDTKEQSFELISQNIYQINDIATDVVSENGFDYPVETTFSTEFYPQKDYSNFSLPSGEYFGLNILIGDAVGQNWWCVLFPPLCSQTAFDTKILTDDDVNFITDGQYELRFKFVDLLSSIRHQTGS